MRNVGLLAQIAPDQRTEPAAQATLLLEQFGGGSRLLGKLLVLARTMGWLRRAFLPDHLHEFGALLAQDPLHAADGVALAVEKMADAA